jgi:hypothetical protein
MTAVFRFLLVLTLCVAPAFTWAASDYSFGFQRLKPQDYLFSPIPESGQDLFDGLRPVEGSINLGIGSDCGKISIDGTLKSAFKNVLDGAYFKGLITDIAGGIPMMTACYMSPTWCSVLKHTQLSANFLTQTRLNQCQIIDKYTDSRTEDYYRERQTCTQKAIQRNGGDMESALASCQNNVFEVKAGKWAGESQDNPNQPNQLIADSAQWAGFAGEDGKKVTSLITSMVGDTVLAQGNLRVEYGPRAHAYPARSYLYSMERNVTEEFCGKILPELVQSSLDGHYVTDTELERKIKDMSKRTHVMTSGETDVPRLLTPELIRNLAYLPPPRRDRICLKLSQALAMSNFTQDMNQSLDVLAAASQNPNLPPNRRKEIEDKRVALKDQVELTLKLRQEQSKPMGEVMQYIAQEGLTAQDQATHDTLTQESAAHSKESHLRRMNDCSDGIFCDESPSRGN